MIGLDFVLGGNSKIKLYCTHDADPRTVGYYVNIVEHLQSSNSEADCNKVKLKTINKQEQLQ